MEINLDGIKTEVKEEPNDTDICQEATEVPFTIQYNIVVKEEPTLEILDIQENVEYSGTEAAGYSKEESFTSVAECLRTPRGVWFFSKEYISLIQYININIEYDSTQDHHCYICETSFTTSLEAVSHLERQHPLKSNLECRTCENPVEASTSGLIKHLEDHEHNYLTSELRGLILNHKYSFFRDLPSSQNVLLVQDSDNREAECKFCSKTFKKFKDFEKHIHFVHKVVGLKCLLCSKWISFEMVELHMETKHEDESSCKFLFQFIESVSKAGREITSAVYVFGRTDSLEKGSKFSMKLFERTGLQNFLECEICDLKFAKIVQLKSHIKSEHYEGDSFRCQKCVSNVVKFNEFRRHMSAHKGNVLFLRSGSSVEYIVKMIESELFVSVEEKNDIKTFTSPCEVCGIANVDLEKHILLKHHITAIKCLPCEELLELKKLKQHVSDAHQDSDNLINFKYLCLTKSGEEEENKKRKYSYSLVVEGCYYNLVLESVEAKHKQVFTCNSCPWPNITFNNGKELQDHVKEVHLFHNFSCDLCGSRKSFDELEAHLKDHVEYFTHSDQPPKFLALNLQGQQALIPLEYEMVLRIQKFSMELTVNFCDPKTLENSDRITCVPCNSSFDIDSFNYHTIPVHKRNLYKCQRCTIELGVKDIIQHIFELHIVDKDQDYIFFLLSKPPKNNVKILKPSGEGVNRKYIFGFASKLIENYVEYGQNFCMKEVENDKMVFECKYCVSATTFENIETFLVHIKEHHIRIYSTPIYTCSICSQMFDLLYFGNLKKHNHPDKTGYFIAKYKDDQTSEMGKRFRDERWNLSVGVAHHLVSGQKLTAFEDHIIIRFQKTLENPWFKCCICVRIYERKQSLKAHVAKKHFRNIDCFCGHCKTDLKNETIVHHLYLYHGDANEIDFISHKKLQDLSCEDLPEYLQNYVEGEGNNSEIEESVEESSLKPKKEKLNRQYSLFLESPDKIIVGCPTSLKDQSILRVIENKNKQSLKFVCNSCPRSYVCARTFKRHLSSRHRTQADAKFVCMICKTVVRFPNISFHMETNHATTGKADFITQNRAYLAEPSDEKETNEGIRIASGTRNNIMDFQPSPSNRSEIVSESPVHEIKNEFGEGSDPQICDIKSSEKVQTDAKVDVTKGTSSEINSAPKKCSYTFQKNSDQFSVLLELSPRSSRNKCAVCQKNYSEFNFRFWFRHLALQHSELLNWTLMELKCKQCKLSTKGLSDLENHARICHDENFRTLFEFLPEEKSSQLTVNSSEPLIKKIKTEDGC